MNGDESVDITILGPTRAGKTHYLAALQRAAMDEGCIYRIRDCNEDLNALFAAGRRLFHEEGRLAESTLQVRDYSFSLEVEPKDGGGLVSSLFRKAFGTVFPARSVVVTDGPGEAVFQHGATTDPEGVRRRILDRLQVAEGVLFCLDANDPPAAGAFWRSLPDLSDLMPNVERVCLMATKCDSLFADDRPLPVDAARTTDPLAHIEELVGTPVLTHLRRSLPRRAVLAVAWSSAYGFAPADGHSNCGEGGRVRIWAKDMPASEMVSSWVPFNVLEPLVFVAHGTREGVVVP